MLANDLDLRVEHLEWLPDTADCEHLRLVVGGNERRIEFRKALLTEEFGTSGHGARSCVRESSKGTVQEGMRRCI